MKSFIASLPLLIALSENCFASEMILRFEKISSFQTRNSLCVNAIDPANGYKSKAMARETTIELKSGRQLRHQEVAYGVDCESVQHMEKESELYYELGRIADEPIEFKLALSNENPDLIESYQVQCLFGAEDCGLMDY